MTLQETMKRLEALGSKGMRESNARKGAGDNQFGVKLGDLRVMAKEIKTDQGLAMKLWSTGNLDAMLLAVLVMSPRQIAAEEMEEMVSSVTHMQVADWFTSYVVKLHPGKEQLRQKWMKSEDTMLARAGWSLTAERISKDSEGLDLGGLLDRIEAEMGGAPEQVQWTMNFCLSGIGINFPEHRERAIAIGEKLGVFRDYPTPKGCTSPFAPIWIAEMVRRQS